MRLLKVKAYQVFANYRKPMNYNFWDTYPLPPLSTIKGWFHHVIDAKEYIPLKMSIQGTINSVVFDLQTLVKFDRLDKQRKEKGLPIIEEVKKVFLKTPTFITNVFDVNLVIYLSTEQLETLEMFKERLMEKDFPHIGRNEDLARIDFVDFVEANHIEFSIDNPCEINYGIYLSKKTAEEHGLVGIHYRMNNRYDIVSGIRYFEKVDVVYVDNGDITSGTFLFDEEEKRIIDLL